MQKIMLVLNCSSNEKIFHDSEYYGEAKNVSIIFNYFSFNYFKTERNITSEVTTVLVTYA